MIFLALVLIVVGIAVVIAKQQGLFLAFSLLVGVGLTLPVLPSWILKPDTGTLFLMVPLFPIALALVIVAIVRGVKALRRNESVLVPALSLVFLIVPVLGYL